MLLFARAAGTLVDASSPPARSTVLKLEVCPERERSRYRTLHEAWAAAKRALATGHRGDVVVELCSGAHPMPDALVITAGDVATAHRNATIEFRGPRDAAATLDAGVAITGWAPSPTVAGVWEAKLPAGAASRQMWIDGRRAPRAHSNPYECSGGPVPPEGLGPAHCGGTLVGGNLTAAGYAGVPIYQPHITAAPLPGWLPGAEFVFM